MSNLRVNMLREFMKENNLHAAVVMSPDYQFYLTGFRALIYSRPIILFITSEQCSLIVPGLEEVHAREHADVDRILPYYEHPEKANIAKTYLEVLENELKAQEGSAVGVDMDYTPGKIINEILNVKSTVIDLSVQIEKMRSIKDDEEISAMIEAGKLVNLGVSETLKHCKVGATELEIDAIGNQIIYRTASENYPNATLDLLVMTPSGPERSILPHVYSNTRKIQQGDVIIHTRQVSLNGYRAELERTVIMGEPTKQQEHAFLAMQKAQQAALDFIRPGVKASEVDAVARGILREEGYAEFAIHRTGHAIGVSLHEPPYLSYDNDLVLEEGMAYTIEPGIYIPGLGGFRHSDTVILKDGGNLLITDYPSNLKELIF
ncbi:Xaa-Pro peptidase family protein [Lysinibacillus sp. SGAir0095]|uniref:M24 family metallopeptidase n=1 Tax=Lysinibacillus sp. SGAir0095 TaxID=2070463 RepID=UPI0010CD4243|nr:Xaa-Pro peptidase family protein [Lysinibacillus sp. SGAir0095]QCR32477.1 aminopeptidase P family protein [Lysinibacillus sp. SGAir0095]